MTGLTLFGVLLGRPRSAASILAGTVLILLVVDPALVWSIGFQLSVEATAGMVALASPIAGIHPEWFSRVAEELYAPRNAHRVPCERGAAGAPSRPNRLGSPSFRAEPRRLFGRNERGR